jgi:hypothetical protein
MSNRSASSASLIDHRPHPSGGPLGGILFVGQLVEDNLQSPFAPFIGSASAGASGPVAMPAVLMPIARNTLALTTRRVRTASSHASRKWSDQSSRHSDGIIIESTMYG